MKANVCLNMIVRNEAHVIERCLKAVAPHIDSWAIVDTGSSDGTQDKIREFMAAAGKPGEVFDRPWRDFGSNRTEALELARGRADYTLIIDADEVLELPQGFKWPKLTADCYQFLHRSGSTDIRFWLTQLVKSTLPFRYVGVLHEVLNCPLAHTSEQLPGPVVHGLFDSARNQTSSSEKYSRDAEVLEAGLLAEPDNARYVFYLAQSYRDAGQPEKAITAYLKRTEMGGFEEEAWYAELQVARLLERVGRKDEAVIAYLGAYNRRPQRMETLCDLARFYREKRLYHLAYLYAKATLGAKPPADVLFLEDNAYKWRGLDEYAVACYWTGRYLDSRRSSEQLLAENRLPASEQERVKKNLQFAIDKLTSKK